MKFNFHRGLKSIPKF